MVFLLIHHSLWLYQVLTWHQKIQMKMPSGPGGDGYLHGYGFLDGGKGGDWVD